MNEKFVTYRGYPGFRQTELNTEVDSHLENIEVLGFSVMENVISREEAETISRRLEILWRKQEDEFGREWLIELGDLGTHRGLMAEDQVFLEMVANPKVLQVIYAILGESAILHLQNGSAAFPNKKHFQSAFHRDFAKDFVATKPLSVNAFWCISEFTADNGCTEVVPFTHRIPTVPSATYNEKNIVKMAAPAGSVIFFDSLLLHRTGFNSTDKTRFGVNHQYTRPFLKQQIDYPVYLKDKVEIESKLGQLLGFWAVPPKSVHEFRVNPDKRTYRRGQG